MAALSKRVEERMNVVEKVTDPGFGTGDLIMCRGQLYRAGELDPNGFWVKLGPHKYGTDICKKVSEVFEVIYKEQCALLAQEPI
jgi:hypothetical protein